MKLYAVVGSWRYEGWDRPSFITADKARAELKRAAEIRDKHYDEVEIVEFTLDQTRHD